jgi:CRISPR-associated endonuclease/helicase Cas3
MSFPSFEQFYRLTWERDPYRWQVRLAEKVYRDGQWPDGLDLPTGSGKTSTLDIAVYVLARSAFEGDLARFPRRIFLVVDRRVLVDQAWRHGTHLLKCVETVPDLSPVREALRRLCPDPPSSIRLRGACPTDPVWCHSVDQVQIIASTVDQVGSRLLLRGYGASARMKPVEAGLVGQDALLILDEAHLSGPFLDTVHRLRELDTVRGIRSRRQVVCMSATPAEVDGEVWFPGEHRQELLLADPLVRDRLFAPRTVQWTTDNVVKVVRSINSPCLLMVANTVRTALEWWKHVEGSTDRVPFLITGRMRPLDRRDVLKRVEGRLERREPTVVVATQCIEAGVDWDFDAMISECASWDSLVQRMGRVNRTGRLGKGDAICTILSAVRGGKQTPKTCPVYGTFELKTAEWLENEGALDCSPGNMPSAPQGSTRPPETAPLLLPEYLDLWSQNRSSGPPFDVSVFLHGLQVDRDVQVVWRDLDIDRDRAHLTTLIKALPPSSLEAVRVPAQLFNEWIAGRPVIRLGSRTEVVASVISPGASVVVPSSYGGIGTHGTFDGKPSAVSDRSADALREHRNLQFQVHDAPPIDEDEDLEAQVRAWIDAEAQRGDLATWTWLDLGHRWLFVSRLPIDDDDDGTTFRRSSVELERHLNGVQERTMATSRRLGLPRELAEDIALAARLHDLGKLDDRFQRMCGRRPGELPLGKSGMSWRERRRRQALSDYPSGERHEALSVELIHRHGLLADAHDPLLVEHLVASHHGWARPFVRSVQGSAAIEDRIFGLDIRTDTIRHDDAQRAPTRFREVQARYGWHGLTWLEAILQLCDHRQSEAEDLGEEGPRGGADLVPGGAVAPVGSAGELPLLTLNGLIPGEYLAALGVLHALHLAKQSARLSWRGTQPVLQTALTMDDLVKRLQEAREAFRGQWGSPLNKMEEAARAELLESVNGPFRSLVVALLSQGGRSDLDFVSGGRGGFTTLFKWATEDNGKGFRDTDLVQVLTGPRTMVKGKSFRWTALAAQGATRPATASNDGRSEPWLEWLSMMGVAAFVAIPATSRWGDLRTRVTGFSGYRFDEKVLRWPLWHVHLSWPDVRAALAASRQGLHDATWCEADRLVFGTAKNRAYAFGAGRLRHADRR